MGWIRTNGPDEFEPSKFDCTMIGCIIDHVRLRVHNCAYFAWHFHCIIMIVIMTLFFFQIQGPIPQDISGIRRQLLRLPGRFRGLGKEAGADRQWYTDQQGWNKGSASRWRRTSSEKLWSGELSLHILWFDISMEIYVNKNWICFTINVYELLSFTDTKFCFRSLTGKDKLLVMADYLHGERPKEIQKLLEADHF